MRLILETDNPKKFIQYSGFAIRALFKQTVGHTGAISHDSEEWVVSYETSKYIVRLYLSYDMKYSDVDANELATALDEGNDINKTFQFSRIETHIIERVQSIPDILGVDLIM